MKPQPLVAKTSLGGGHKNLYVGKPLYVISTYVITVV